MSIQAGKNNEKYIIRETFFSKYSDFFEFIAHKMFENSRVEKTVGDGRTEWFMVTWDELRDGILKIKKSLIRLYGDCGLEGYKLNKLPC